MAHRSAALKPEDRLSIRASASQKTTLRRAADARHMNVSQFVLQASLQEAERLIAEETTIRLTPEQFQWVVELMDAPPRELPELRDLVRRKPVWDA